MDILGAIRIEGNHAIATGALEPGLALHEAVRDGAALDPYLLATDTERIRAAYLKRGFFEVKVASRVEHREGHTQDVVFTITEGRRAVTRVEIAGLPPELPASRARAQVALRDGAPFDYDTYEAAKQALAAFVVNAGYARATIEGKVIADPAAATATARYEIKPGVRCTFGAIAIRNTGHLEASLAAAVRARLRFATGDRYSAAALEASQAEIYELGRFSTVQVGPDHGSDAAVDNPVVDIAVELVLANRHELHGAYVDLQVAKGTRLAGGDLSYLQLTPELRGYLSLSGTVIAVRVRAGAIWPFPSCWPGSASRSS